MVNKCCIPRCRGNYDKQNKAHVFKIPEDEELRAKWLLAIPRKDFSPSKTTVVCHKHFPKEDVLWETRHFDDRTGRHVTAPLERPRLKPDAIPKFFNVWRPLPKRLKDGCLRILPVDNSKDSSEAVQPSSAPERPQLSRFIDNNGKPMLMISTMEQLERKKRQEIFRKAQESVGEIQRKEEQRRKTEEDEEYMKFIASLWPKYAVMMKKKQRMFRQTAIMLLNELLDEQEAEKLFNKKLNRRKLKSKK